MDVKVTVRGPLFDKKIDKTVKAAIVEECLLKINARLTRAGARGSGGRGLGTQRNTVGTVVDINAITLTAESTLIFPRTTGRAWAQKNMAIVRAMAPRVMRKTALRIVGELG